MVICSEPVSWLLIGCVRHSPTVAPTFCLSFSLLFAARGRDQEEEGGSHRPGDHELRESVSARDQRLLGKKCCCSLKCVTDEAPLSLQVCGRPEAPSHSKCRLGICCCRHAFVLSPQRCCGCLKWRLNLSYFTDYILQMLTHK